MKQLLTRLLKAMLAAGLIFSTTGNAMAAEEYIGGGKTSAEAPTFWGMTIDLVALRPLGFGATLLGSGIFLVSLPITLGTGSVDIAAEKLVREPASFTFQRPLGTWWELEPDNAR